MKKRIALLASAMTLAAGGVSGVAYAAITDSGNPGHPDKNPAGKCPAGQNKDKSPGAFADNKCD